MKRIESLTEKLNSFSPRSAWNRGVKAYALELVEELTEAIESGWQDADIIESPKTLERALLNGASDWKQYSEGGCSLIYDREIAERLCNATELKLTKHGELYPNRRENWIDCQARALYQAAELVKHFAEIVTHSD